MDPRTATARKVASAIEAAKLTRQQVSDLTGIPKTTLLRKLRGHSSFTICEIASVAKAVGVKPAALISFEEVAA